MIGWERGRWMDGWIDIGRYIDSRQIDRYR